MKQLPYDKTSKESHNNAKEKQVEELPQKNKRI